jgi:hypothetical protein
MSCEQAKADVEQAWIEWQTALEKLTSLVNLGGVITVDDAGVQAIDVASQGFAAADRKFLNALRRHLTAGAAHRPSA